MDAIEPLMHSTVAPMDARWRAMDYIGAPMGCIGAPVGSIGASWIP